MGLLGDIGLHFYRNTGTATEVFETVFLPTPAKQGDSHEGVRCTHNDQLGGCSLGAKYANEKGVYSKTRDMSRGSGWDTLIGLIFRTTFRRKRRGAKRSSVYAVTYDEFLSFSLIREGGEILQISYS